MATFRMELAVSGQYGSQGLRIHVDQTIVELPGDFDVEKASVEDLAKLGTVIRDRLMDLDVEVNRQLAIFRRNATDRADNELAKRQREKAAANGADTVVPIVG